MADIECDKVSEPKNEPFPFPLLLFEDGVLEDEVPFPKPKRKMDKKVERRIVRILAEPSATRSVNERTHLFLFPCCFWRMNNYQANGRSRVRRQNRALRAGGGVRRRRNAPGRRAKRGRREKPSW